MFSTFPSINNQNLIYYSVIYNLQKTTEFNVIIASLTSTHSVSSIIFSVSSSSSLGI